MFFNLGYCIKSKYKELPRGSHGAKLCLFTNRLFKKKNGKKPLMWLCYIGIFFIWTYDEKSLSNFFSFADSLMANYTMKSHIKFKTHISTTNINFLDAKVTFKNGKRIYLICYKPSDAHLYLYWSSCHL